MNYTDVPRLLRAARAGGAKYKRETDEVGPPGTDGTVYERGRFLAIGPDGSSSVSSGKYVIMSFFFSKIPSTLGFELTPFYKMYHQYFIIAQILIRRL